MDVRITPLANFTLLKKDKPAYSFSRSLPEINKRNQAQPALTIQKPAKTKKSFLLLPSTRIQKPRALLNISSHNIQPAMNVNNKNAMLLYQQIERNKLSPGGAELINRFNFKV